MRMFGIISGAGRAVLASALCLSVAVLLASCGGGSGGSGFKLNPEDSLQQVGYMLGRDMGRSLMNIKNDMGAAFDERAFLLALRDVLDSVPSRLPDSVLSAVDMKLKKEFDEKRSERQRQAEEKQKQVAEEALKVANAFLEENKGKKDVKVTESGLQYIVLTEGKGPKPSLKDKVKVHYHGTLTDGTIFDSSLEKNVPVTFAVERVIAGWREVLQLMPVGSKYKVFVPPSLGYGKVGARPPIGPNVVLIFEIELLGIEK